MPYPRAKPPPFGVRANIPGFVAPALATSLGPVWVKPSLSAEVEYRAKSAEGKLRHPSFKGLRDDL